MPKTLMCSVKSILDHIWNQYRIKQNERKYYYLETFHNLSTIFVFQGRFDVHSAEFGGGHSKLVTMHIEESSLTLFAAVGYNMMLYGTLEESPEDCLLRSQHIPRETNRFPRRRGGS